MTEPRTSGTRRGASPNDDGAVWAAHAFEDAASAQVDELGGVDLDVFRASFDLVRLSTRLVQAFERHVHRPAGWSMAGFRVMFCVWIADELEPREIARLSGLSRAAVSSVLNTLERDGLVERSRESDDRRLVTVRLTARGRGVIVDAYRAQHEVERRAFEALDVAELRDFVATLRRLLDAPGPGRGAASVRHSGE